jgi:hypothetical protein
MRRWITRAEFEALMEAGVFPREERLELLAGELTRREAVSPLRGGCDLPDVRSVD